MAAPMALVGLGSAAAGGITSAFGAFAGGQSQAAFYNYQAGVAKTNATIAQQNANYAVYAGEVRAQQSGMKTAAEIGTTKAMQGAGGLDVSSGSNVDVRTSELEVGQENQALIRSNAAKTAFGYEVEESQFTAQAGADLAAGRQAKTAGDIGAIGSLIGGAGSVASKWSDSQRAGVFS
jgi:hypothetical protein